MRYRKSLRLWLTDPGARHRPPRQCLQDEKDRSAEKTADQSSYSSLPAVNRDSPDDCRSAVDIHAIPAFLQDRARCRRLPAPWAARTLPRSPAQTEISQFNANRPELAAICARILSLQSADWIAGTVLRSLSLPWKIAFPDGGSWPW